MPPPSSTLFLVTLVAAGLPIMSGAGTGAVANGTISGSVSNVATGIQPPRITAGVQGRF